jgi:CDP-diacylglycerol--serine O-phosphatidyltransferase
LIAEPPRVATAVKRIAVVPTLLTLGNAVCGLAAIAYASKIDKIDTPADLNAFYLSLSGWLILAAMVFDALDGYFARLFKAAGLFGAELDSLCDAVSFGAAPAFLLLQLGPGRSQPLLHSALASVATLYMMCALLRLARYNVEALQGIGSGKKFRGLPSPAAAGCLATLAVFRGGLGVNWPHYDSPAVHTAVAGWATLGGLVVALLMVSAVAYPHLTKQMLRGRKGAPLMTVVPVVVLLVLLRDLGLALAFWLYALGGLLQYVVGRALPRRRLAGRIGEIKR